MHKENGDKTDYNKCGGNHSISSVRKRNYWGASVWIST